MTALETFGGMSPTGLCKKKKFGISFAYLSDLQVNMKIILQADQNLKDKFEMRPKG